MIKFEVKGSGRVAATLVSKADALDDSSAKGLRIVADEIRDDAKRLCPVDTGSLRESIRVEVTAKPAGVLNAVKITAGGHVTNPRTGRKVDYAPHVEWGTSRMRPQPFMRPAVEMHRADILRALLGELRGLPQ